MLIGEAATVLMGEHGIALIEGHFIFMGQICMRGDRVLYVLCHEGG
jgi:hypothetical protein